MAIPTDEEIKAWLMKQRVCDLAEALGVSTKTIYRWRWGAFRPDADNVRALARLMAKRKSA